MDPFYPRKLAKQIIRSSFEQILEGKFQMPPQDEIEPLVRESFFEPFDEYHARKKIKCIHPDWGEDEISDKIEKEKDRHIRKISMNVNWFAQDTIKEMEKLLDSLNQVIAKWKAHNL
jgi:hypothetical protein